MKQTTSTPTISDIPPFIIAIDDREKDGHHLIFPQGTATKICHLPFGDYSLVGFEKRIAIERKSLTDLIQTLWSHSILADGTKQQNSKRFAYELQRMRDAGARRYVVIEGTESALRQKFAYRAQVVHRYGFNQRADFDKTMSFISSLEMRYGTIFKFCTNEDDAAEHVYRSLYHAYRLFVGLSRDPVGDYKPPHNEPHTIKMVSPDFVYDIKEHNEKSGV